MRTMAGCVVVSFFGLILVHAALALTGRDACKRKMMFLPREIGCAVARLEW